MTTKTTYDLNVTKHYDDITEIRTVILQKLLSTDFSITACGFVDGAPFLEKRKGIFSFLQKTPHFCISLGHTMTTTHLYIALPYELPDVKKIPLYISQILMKYDKKKFKHMEQRRIILNKIG